MVTTASTSTSLKDYLKKYESNNEEDKKKKKKKKKAKPVAPGVLVVDEDPVWQKPVNLEEDEENDSPDEKPIVDEDIEVKRMRRLEQIRARHAYNHLSEDGSGWISVSDAPKGSASADPSEDISPPRKRTTRYDTPSPDNRPNHSGSVRDDADLSPPRQRRQRNDSPSPEPGDLSPPRRRGRSSGSPSVVPVERSSVSGFEDSGLGDLSPPRRGRPGTLKVSRESEDLSPPRKNRKGNDGMDTDVNGAVRRSKEGDLSPPRKRRSEQKTGLITGKDVSEEIAKTKKEEWLRFKEMDASASGQGAEPVYRIKGQRVSKEEYLKLTKKAEKKPKEEKKLEWGKGLAQKREAEARLVELELEKEKPFARSRDDPELDRVMRDRLRWGDPMAHLVKRKQPELALPDLGENEKMKESGFIIPQDIPSHSWIKRGLDYAPNRYGIKPGRHWDGVDRSNGYEKQMFKRMNEKRATEREAYLWSVSDM